MMKLRTEDAAGDVKETQNQGASAFASCTGERKEIEENKKRDEKPMPAKSWSTNWPGAVETMDLERVKGRGGRSRPRITDYLLPRLTTATKLPSTGPTGPLSPECAATRQASFRFSGG